MIRKTLALFVIAALAAGPALATTGTSSGGSGGAVASSSAGGHGGGGSAGHSGGGSGGHVGSSLSGPHAHGAAHAMTAHAVSASSHASGHHHHHHYFPGGNLANGHDFNNRDGLAAGCPPLIAMMSTERTSYSCAGPTKMRIDPVTGAPAP